MLEFSMSHAFDDFRLEVEFVAPAGVTALFGRSGSGKTSVISAIAGLAQFDRLSITYDGADLHSLAPHKRRVGCVFQDHRLFPHLNVRGNLRFGQYFQPKGGLSFDAVIDMLGIEGVLNRQPNTLSGGEKQRVSIGRALLSNPKILLMDEPLSALDYQRKAEILPYIQRLRDEAGLPILYVSHDLSEVTRLATSLVVLDRGKVRSAGPLASVLADPAVADVLGPRAHGVGISARLVSCDADGLACFQTAGGFVFLAGVHADRGALTTLWISATDVMISLTAPQGISALNVLPVQVVAVQDASATEVILSLAMGSEQILARITKRSFVALNLTPGLLVFAVLKSVAMAAGQVHRPGQGPDI